VRWRVELTYTARYAVRDAVVFKERAVRCDSGTARERVYVGVGRA
jgi:hypothetical protein